VTVESLIILIDQLTNCGYGGQQFKALLDWLEGFYPQFVKKILEQIRKGKISFDGLWFLFQKGNRFFSKVHRNQLIGSEVTALRYDAGGMLPPSFNIAGEVIKSDGTKYYKENKNYLIYYYEGLKDIISLDIQPMTQNILDYLTERGKRFEKVALGHHYKHYERFIFF